MKKVTMAKITAREIWKDYIRISLKSPQIAMKAAPGQFIMIRITPNSHPLLRRPFSINSVERGDIAIFFQKSGLGTNLLSLKKKGDRLDILGPLGKGFNLKGAFSDKKITLIGGGRGIAPLFFLAQSLAGKKAKINIFYGGKTSYDLPLKEKFKAIGLNVLCSTEDGSSGYKGVITDQFSSQIRDLQPDKIYACGPEAMLKKVIGISDKENIPAEVSLESIMGCGFGACWGCVKRIKKEGEKSWMRICKEGPVFPAEQIIWGKENK